MLNLFGHCAEFYILKFAKPDTLYQYWIQHTDYLQLKVPSPKKPNTYIHMHRKPS